jgi:hypothetical protein
MLYLVVKEWQSRIGTAEIIDIFETTDPADNLALQLQFKSTLEVSDARALRKMESNRMVDALRSGQCPEYEPGDMSLLWKINEAFQGDITFRVAELSSEEDFSKRGITPKYVEFDRIN